MKFISNYKELGGDSNVSLSMHIGDVTHADKEKILFYLKNGKSDGVRCSAIYDHVKEFSTGITVQLYTDEEFYWDSEEIYHFEKYNLQLEAEFIKKVTAREESIRE